MGKDDSAKFESSFFMSEDGKKISGGVGLGLEKILEISTGMHDPTGSAGKAAAAFAQSATPFAIDASQKMMETAYAQSQTEADRYMQVHPIRTAEGIPATAEEARTYAFSGDEESKTLTRQHKEANSAGKKSNVQSKGTGSVSPKKKFKRH